MCVKIKTSKKLLSFLPIAICSGLLVCANQKVLAYPVKDLYKQINSGQMGDSSKFSSILNECYFLVVLRHGVPEILGDSKFFVYLISEIYDLKKVK